MKAAQLWQVQLTTRELARYGCDGAGYFRTAQRIVK